jgi:hypothetical protein
MSEPDTVSSISLKQLAALYVSNSMTEENFLLLASRFFASASRPPTPSQARPVSSRLTRNVADADILMSTAKRNGPVDVQGTGRRGDLAAFSAATASPQLRQTPMNDSDRYLFSMDLQNMFVLLRVPNLRESDAIRCLACLDPMSVHRCIEQLRRCRSKDPERPWKSQLFEGGGSVSIPVRQYDAQATPKKFTPQKYNSPMWTKPAALPFSTPAKSSDPQAIHVVRKEGVVEAAIFSSRSANQTKYGSNSRQRPMSAPPSKVWKTSGNGAPPQTSALATERSYALTHRDQVARDIVGVLGWVGDVAIDTTSPASLARRKAKKDFRVATVVYPKLPKQEVHEDFVQKSAKKNGMLSHQTNTTSVVIKALQQDRESGTQAGRHKLPDDRMSSQLRSSSTSAKWIQSDARFTMHQRRRQILQQLQ